MYQTLGLDYTREKESRMRDVLRTHGRNRYGVHRYHLGSFGISRTESEAAFGEYRERFAIPIENDRE
jgi:hypothetical protein